MLRRLGRRFRLVLVDNRGSGGSDLPWALFRVADMAADVVAVLDDAGIRRAHVMGMSLGGMVAQELAVGYPDRVDGLVLVSTSPGWPFACPIPAAPTVLLAASRAIPPGKAARRPAGNTVPADGAAREPELVGRLISLQRSRPTGPRAWMAQAAAGAGDAGQLRQTRIRARTLVLHGTADTVVDPRNGPAAGAPDPRGAAGDLPRAGSRAVLAGSGRLRRRGQRLPAAVSQAEASRCGPSRSQARSSPGSRLITRSGSAPGRMGR